MRKRPWVVVAFALLSVLAVTLVAQAFYLDSRRQRLENLYHDAQIARLTLAQQPAPAPDEPLRPAAERALERLRQAAALRPARRLYEEALDVLLVEHRGGRRVYPRADGTTTLPRACVQPDTEFARPFAWTPDGTGLVLFGLVYQLDTGARRAGPTPPGARQRGPEFSADGSVAARIAGDDIQVYAVSTDTLIRSIQAVGASAVALSPDGAVLAWSPGVSGVGNTGVQLVRVADGSAVRLLLPTGPVAVVRLAYTPDGKYIVGHAGYSKRDYIYNSSGRGGADGGLTPEYQEHTDRVCIWDAVDGALVAWLPGRAFADGFGPHGELAVARAVSSTVDTADLEIDLWHPAALIAALERNGLADWVHFATDAADGDSSIASWLSNIAFGLLWVAIAWLAATLTRIQKKRITVAWAHAGIALTAVLIVVGALCFAAVVAEFAGQWDRALALQVANLPGIHCGLAGLGDVLLALCFGKLALQCYTYAAHGEAVAAFEELQAIPEVEQRRGEQRARRFGKAVRRWFVGLYLGLGTLLVLAAYLDGSVLLHLFPLPPAAWGFDLVRSLGMWYVVTTMTLLPSLFALPLVYALVAVAAARWEPAREPWYKPPDGKRSLSHLFSLFPLGRAATVAYWLVVLVAALGVAGFELYSRLADGHWPRPLDALELEPIAIESTGLLALAVLYVIVSLMRLAWLATRSDRPSRFISDP